jgi:heme-degrading monooxygenase HmoA
MIRVIYRWRVEEAHHQDFTQWWHEGTLRIRSSYPGAMGSTLCKPISPSDQFVAIARWQSQENLTRFWEDSGGSELPWAVAESVEIIEEMDHLTKEN